MSELRQWIWLAEALQNDMLTASSLLDYFGTVEKVYFASEKEYLDSGCVGQNKVKLLKDKSLTRMDEILRDCAAFNIGVISIEDAEYPNRLRDLIDAPLVLYYRGNFPRFDNEAAIAVVGTRNIDQYGESIGRQIGYEICAGGGIVVSGMALGGDTSAHEGALKAGGVTVAVLGSGVDVIYPQSNAYLYSQILERGAIISEYPPGTSPNKWNFPRRNRIISGLSLGTVLLRADVKSGTMITVNCALEQGRDVYAVPGNVDSRLSLAGNQLIRDGATSVTSGYDVLDEYISLFPEKLNVERKIYSPNDASRQVPASSRPAKPEPDLTGYDEKQQRILKAIGEYVIHVDEVSAKTGLASEELLAEVTMLEIGGAITVLPGMMLKRML